MASLNRQVKKQTCYVSSCVVCGELALNKIIATDPPNNSDLFVRYLCFSNARQGIRMAIICDSDICYNMALLNPIFFWQQTMGGYTYRKRAITYKVPLITVKCSCCQGLFLYEHMYEVLRYTDTSNVYWLVGDYQYQTRALICPSDICFNMIVLGADSHAWS